MPTHDAGPRVAASSLAEAETETDPEHVSPEPEPSPVGLCGPQPIATKAFFEQFYAA